MPRNESTKMGLLNRLPIKAAILSLRSFVSAGLEPTPAVCPHRESIASKVPCFKDDRGNCAKFPMLLLANDAPHRAIVQT
jgi:hypothetical protein